MDLLALLLLATARAAPPVQDPEVAPTAEVWAAAWGDLEALRRLPAGSAERRRLATELGDFVARHGRRARKHHDRVSAFRARVLAAHLSIQDDEPFRPVPDPLVPVGWLPGEPWLAAQVADSGPTRILAIEVAIDEAAPAELGERAAFALELARTEARELHGPESIRLARALHRRLPSDDEVVLFLARASRAAGEHAEGLAVVEERLGSSVDAPTRGRLLAESGRLRLASGDGPGAARDLGEGLALGSPVAAWLLARSALSEGAVQRARALGRSLVSSPEEAPVPRPALRGYGLALLPGGGPRAPTAGNPVEPVR